MRRHTHREPCGCTYNDAGWVLMCTPCAAEFKERHTRAQEEHVRFDPRTGERVVYQDAADASEHRLRLMEDGLTHLDFMGENE